MTSLSDPTPRLQLSRDQIMLATGLCLVRDGYDATTIRRIAGELRCAVGSIYRYFRDKRELLLAVTQQAMQPVLNDLAHGATLAASLGLYHHVASLQPENYRLMFWLSQMEPTQATLPPVIGQIMQAWAERTDARAAQAGWVTLHGLIMLGQTQEVAVAAAIAQMEAVRATRSRVNIAMPGATVSSGASESSGAPSTTGHLTPAAQAFLPPPAKVMPRPTIVVKSLTPPPPESVGLSPLSATGMLGEDLSLL